MNCTITRWATLAAVFAFCGSGAAQDFAADLAALRKVADDPGAPGREEAIRTLVKLDYQVQSIRGIFVGALNAEDPKVRLAGAEGLAAMGPAVGAPDPFFFKVLRDRDVRVRQAMVGVLSHIGPLGKRQAVRPLVERLNGDPDIGIRRSAARALGLIGPYAKDGVPALIAALNDPDDPSKNAGGSVQDHAIQALGDIGPDAAEAAPGAIAIAKDDRDPRRLEAILALGGMGAANKDVLPALLDFIKPIKNTMEMRGCAAAALGRLGPGKAAQETVPALISMLTEEEPNPVHGPGTPGPLVNARCAAAESLSRLGPEAKPAVKALVEVMMDPNASDEVNRWAANALIALGPDAKDAVPALVDMLHHPNVPAYAVTNQQNALIAIGKDAVPAVTEMLKSTDPYEARSAMQILIQIGPDAEAAVPALRELAKSSDPMIKASAEHALKVITGE